MESGPTPPRTEGGSRGERALSSGIPALAVVLVVAGLIAAHLARSPVRSPVRSGEQRRGIDRDPAPVYWVDPAEARLADFPGWADPRWAESLRALLARRPPFDVGSQGALADLAAELATLSFVRGVERCRASTAGGLELELLLRRPVACLPGEDGFVLVDEEGVVLEGAWPVPPRLGRAFLPVIGPLGDELLARARAGDWLVEPEHRDALDVALSLREHLGEDERAALGRVLVDARASRRASVEEPGIRLELEGARLALFGRAPSADDPGELPVSAKWRSLVQALELFERDPTAHDWELVDLRWDRPDLALRRPHVLASAEERAPPVRPGGPVRQARDAARRQVR